MNRPFNQKLLTDDSAIDIIELVEKADKGDIISQFLLGLHYYEGVGVEQDYVEAVKWFEKAAKEGDSDAQYFLGQCYILGRGVDEKNASEALSWFKKASDQNNDEAQFKIGLIYEYGDGVPQSDTEALEWYRKSIAQDEEDKESNARYRANALEADLKRRSLICGTFKNSDIKFGYRLFSLDTDYFYLATQSNPSHEKRDKAVEMINDKCNGYVFEKDILFWNEPQKPNFSTVIITAESLFYLQKKEIKQWRFEDINEIDWERKTDGCILINGTPCKIVTNYRKPFVDAMKIILDKIRQENKQ